MNSIFRGCGRSVAFMGQMFLLVLALLGCRERSGSSSEALAQPGTISDSPVAIWQCSDNVADGGVRLIISRDQFRQLGARFIQADQIAGASILAEFARVQSISNNNGLTPAFSFGGLNLRSERMFNGFINITRSTNPQQGDGLFRLAVGDTFRRFNLSCRRANR